MKNDNQSEIINKIKDTADCIERFGNKRYFVLSIRALAEQLEEARIKEFCQLKS